MVIQGNAALVELLVQEGVDLLVGNPGSTELALMDALATDGRIRYVLALQESIVLGIADGFAQATGRLAAVNLHAAPGLATPSACSLTPRRPGSPILVTAGQQDQSVLLSEPMLGDDLATMARPLRQMVLRGSPPGRPAACRSSGRHHGAGAAERPGISVDPLRCADRIGGSGAGRADPDRHRCPARPGSG